MLLRRYAGGGLEIEAVIELGLSSGSHARPQPHRMWQAGGAADVVSQCQAGWRRAAPLCCTVRTV